MLRNLLITSILLTSVGAFGQTSGIAPWQNDLTPIGPADWNYDSAAHLLERAGFGGTPEEVQALANLTPAQAVARMVHFEGVVSGNLPAFDESGIHDPGLEPFPPTRPALTDLAKKNGMKTLKEYAMFLMAEGLTSVDEVVTNLVIET